MEGGAYRRTAVRKRGRGSNGSSKVKTKHGTSRMMSKQETDQLLGIIRNLMNHALAGPFNAPVDPYEVPDYLDVIKNPMDFATIKDQLKAGVYSTAEEFADDVRLVFENCYTYNMSGSQLCLNAQTLANYFESCYAYREQQSTEELEAQEMQEIIEQLRSEHDKLLGELNKLVKSTKTSPGITQPKVVAKHPTKKQKRDDDKKDKAKAVSVSTPKINSSPVIYKYELADKERLTQKIHSLNQDNLQKMVDLLSSEIAEFKDKNGEVEIDLELLSDASLSRIEQFVSDCIRQQERDTIKTEPSKDAASPPQPLASKQEGTNSDSESSSSESEDDNEDEDDEDEFK